MEVIDSSATSYSSCPIELILNGADPIILGGTVTYSEAKTPLLTAINPRYGTVDGGELITFTGTNFRSEPSNVKILLDNVECAV